MDKQESENPIVNLAKDAALVIGGTIIVAIIIAAKILASGAGVCCY